MSFLSHLVDCLCSTHQRINEKHLQSLSLSGNECNKSRPFDLAHVGVFQFEGCLSSVVASSANSMPLDPLRIVTLSDSWNSRSEVNQQSFILLKLVRCVTSITVTRREKNLEKNIP